MRKAPTHGRPDLPGRGSPKPPVLEALSPFLSFVLRQSGLDARDYQPKALNRRFAACLRVLRAPSERAAMLALRRQPELLHGSLSALLIGVSGFFRDEAVFEHLRERVLPPVLKNGGPVRVYSAGCSAGQELYSTGMILDELGALKRSYLLGVDCRADAIAQARSGCFAASELAVLGNLRRQRYFQIHGPQAVVSPRLRERTTWRVADFGKFRDAEGWDLILFRNAAIYLDAEYANCVWRRLDRQLKPGGVVVTGSAERPPDSLRWKREAACIYRKSTTFIT